MVLQKINHLLVNIISIVKFSFSEESNKEKSVFGDFTAFIFHTVVCYYDVLESKNILDSHCDRHSIHAPV